MEHASRECRHIARRVHQKDQLGARVVQVESDRLQMRLHVGSVGLRDAAADAVHVYAPDAHGGIVRLQKLAPRLQRQAATAAQLARVEGARQVLSRALGARKAQGTAGGRERRQPLYGPRRSDTPEKSLLDEE